jgi:hypothetical protein
MAQNDKLLGVVNEVGLERDDQEFRNFTITLGIKIKTEKKINYSEGEKLMKQLQKDLMGKNIELGAVAVPCPICGRVYNSEQGMRQHKRLQHKEDEKKEPKRRGRKKKAEPKKTNNRTKNSKKKKSR